MFGISRGDTAPPFEMQEGVFDQVAQRIQIFVVGPWRGSVCSGRDHDVHALTASLLDDRRAVIAFISDQMLCREAFDQAASLRTIRRGTLRKNDSERHTMRIHGQMYLGLEPPFVRLMSWLPRADARCNGWRQASAIHSPAPQ